MFPLNLAVYCSTMDLRSPISGVVPSLHGPVLVVLARSLRALSGREVSRLVGDAGSQRGVLDVLNRLTEHGIVEREERPPSALFRLNRDHLAAEPVLQLVGLRERLFWRIRTEEEGWDLKAEYLGVFGSAARGDGGTGSDIDVVVVRADEVPAVDGAWAKQLDDLEASIRRWSGNRAEVVEYGRVQLLELGRRRDPFVKAELLHDARDIVGPPLVALLSGVRRR